MDEVYRLPGGYRVVLARVQRGFWRKWVGRVYVGSSSTANFMTQSSISKNEVIEAIVERIGIPYSAWERVLNGQ